jgi:hypothetical protein
MASLTRLACAALLVAAASACGDDGGGNASTVYFELGGMIDTADTFFDLPFPSDLRLTPTGSPDMTGFPNRRNVPILVDLLSLVPARSGFPVMPVAYVRFTAPLPARDIATVVPPTDALLVDIDETSPEIGTTFPIVATTFGADAYAPSDLVGLAPRPGVVLRGHTRYAYVILRAFAPGFTPPRAISDMAGDRAPVGTRGAQAFELYQPLWPVLDAASIARDDVLVATVFTTGDEVARMHARSEAIRAAYHPVLENVATDAMSPHDGFCVVHATIRMPQFQIGTQPFDHGGTFVLDANDVPMQQGEMTISRHDHAAVRHDASDRLAALSVLSRLRRALDGPRRSRSVARRR